MSAQPAPNPQPSDQTRRDQNAELVEALLADADLHQKLQASRARLRRAAARNPSELPYIWTTPNDREAELRVYYLPGEHPQILAGELVKLDGRKPTQREAAELEDAFDAEIQTNGDLWLRVASAIWQRTA